MSSAVAICGVPKPLRTSDSTSSSRELIPYFSAARRSGLRERKRSTSTPIFGPAGPPSGATLTTMNGSGTTGGGRHVAGRLPGGCHLPQRLLDDGRQPVVGKLENF